MKLDQEIEVLSRCYDLISQLDDDVKVRVLQWLSSKFHLGHTTLTLASNVVNGNGEGGMEEGVTASAAPEKPSAPETKPAAGGSDDFGNFTEMYRAVRPSSDAEKALVAAVYLSSYRGMSEVSSAQVQKELKNIGERVSNITQAISALVKKKLIMQLGKEGNSQQARKKYKITPEAARMVEDMLRKRA